MVSNAPNLSKVTAEVGYLASDHGQLRIEKIEDVPGQANWMADLKPEEYHLFNVWIPPTISQQLKTGQKVVLHVHCAAGPGHNSYVVQDITG